MKGIARALALKLKVTHRTIVEKVGDLCVSVSVHACMQTNLIQFNEVQKEACS